jgi:dTDP-glucose 4,6-dehydratase
MNRSYFNGKKVLVTGGLGFIGSCVVRTLLEESTADIQIIDKFGVGSNLKSLNLQYGHRYKISPLDLAWTDKVIQTSLSFDPEIIIHLAAESHVDRSISGPATFVASNVTGTFSILEAARRCYENSKGFSQRDFKFHHVSTDEVFGSLDSSGSFNESSPYDPRSPYSATKAASDHLVRAWHHTYKLPVTISNCSNNYGPWQADEKLIPTAIRSILDNKPVQLYGDGSNVRDWLYVQDHVDAILACVERGKIGSTYCVGTRCERSNVDLIYDIFNIFKSLDSDYSNRAMSINYIKDRPGHDFRYSIDPSKIEAELNWSPRFEYSAALRDTVDWYIKQYSND